AAHCVHIDGLRAFMYVRICTDECTFVRLFVLFGQRSGISCEVFHVCSVSIDVRVRVDDVHFFSAIKFCRIYVCACKILVWWAICMYMVMCCVCTSCVKAHYWFFYMCFYVL